MEVNCTGGNNKVTLTYDGRVTILERFANPADYEKWSDAIVAYINKFSMEKPKKKASVIEKIVVTATPPPAVTIVTIPDFDNMSIVELRASAKEYGVKASGKKADMIKRLKRKVK